MRHTCSSQVESLLFFFRQLRQCGGLDLWEGLKFNTSVRTHLGHCPSCTRREPLTSPSCSVFHTSPKCDAVCKYCSCVPHCSVANKACFLRKRPRAPQLPAPKLPHVWRASSVGFHVSLGFTAWLLALNFSSPPSPPAPERYVRRRAQDSAETRRATCAFICS